MNKVILSLLVAVCVLGMALIMLNERLRKPEPATPAGIIAPVTPPDAAPPVGAGSPVAAPITAGGPAGTAQPQPYLTNDEAAEYLRLSPRTLEKQRVIGGGPKFRKFGRRVMYAVSDLDAWADARSYAATSDPEYAERHAGDYRDGR